VSPFDLAGLEKRLNEINKETEADGFWDDHERAQKLLKEKKSLELKINEFKELSGEFEDIGVLIELAE